MMTVDLKPAITKAGVGGFFIYESIVERNSDPRQRRPYDKDRDGFVTG